MASVGSQQPVEGSGAGATAGPTFSTAVPPVHFSTHDLCEAAVDYVLVHSNTIQYLIQSIEGIAEIPFPRTRFKCLPTDAKSNRRRGGLQVTASGLDANRVAAGYMWRRARPDCEKGDIVFVEEGLDRFMKAPKEQTSASGQNSVLSRSGMDAAYLEAHQPQAIQEMERNMRHELIHAFDDARGFVNSADCTHQACSEIRAARLSGDCFVANEAKKGRFDYFQGGMQCVRRRATMAVEMNPVCRGFSDRAVETVFRRCYSDYEPFSAPVYALGNYGEATFSSAALQAVSSTQK